MTIRLRSLLIVLLVLASYPLVSQEQPGESFNVNAQGVALDGYDPVAYFTEDEATPGDPSISALYDGVTFYFASRDNRELFESSPELYLPQYGGWCAWAASRGDLAAIDPEQYVIHEDRLFLNYSGWLNFRFKRNLDENVDKADDNWPGLLQEAIETAGTQ